MIRSPAVAGQFYPNSTAELQDTLATFIDNNLEKEDALGAIVPHAGYIYSGKVAGEVFSRLEITPTVVILGPNHTGIGVPFSVMTRGQWQTPLGLVNINEDLAGAIEDNSNYLKADHEAHYQEHSIEVQVPFLKYMRRDVRIVPIILSSAKIDVYDEVGKVIGMTIRATKSNVLILASSDMSHYESHIQAGRKDQQAILSILQLDEVELLHRVYDQDISMCGYAPVATMLVATRELGANKAELVKYQTSGEVSGDYERVVGYAGIIIRKITHSALVELAREAIGTFIEKGTVIDPPYDLTPEMKEKAGVFVSIKKHGGLRGCIGTYDPSYGNVAEETIANGISAAIRDPRFNPISKKELKELDISVDVLSHPEAVESIDELDAKIFGVIVEHGSRRGLLLPNLEGVATPSEQIAICRQKAGISPDESVKLYRFKVKRYL
jgi:AmmeMemoRadiSam system protein B/AmmeMemoRadiSam system protein A